MLLHSIPQFLSNRCPITGLMRRNSNLGGRVDNLSPLEDKGPSGLNGLTMKVLCSSQVLGTCKLNLFQRAREVTPTQQVRLLKNRLHPEFSRAKKALACVQC